MNAEQMYQAKCELWTKDIFGPWTKDSLNLQVFTRHEAGRRQDDRRVTVFYSNGGEYGDETYCAKPGWYWELGIGVGGMFGASNCEREPLATAEEAMAFVDEILRKCGAVMVLPMPERKAVAR